MMKRLHPRVQLKRRYVQLPVPVKTSVLYTFCNVLQKGIAFMTVPVYVRLIPPEQYGYYTLYQSWNGILIIFATLNFWHYFFNNGMLKYRDSGKFISALTGLDWLLTTAAFAVNMLLFKWFRRISGLPLIVLLLMYAGFYLRPSYEYWSAKQRFEYDIHKYVITSVWITVFTPVVSIAFILAGKKAAYSQLGVALIAGNVLCSGIVYLCVMLAQLKKSTAFYNREVWSYALRFNVPLIPHFLSGMILSLSDRIMIGSMCGKREAAIYGLASSTALVMQIINEAIMNAIIPWTYKRMQEKNYDRFSFVSNMSLLIIVIINLLVVLAAPEILRVIATEEYQEAVYIIPPVAVSNVFIFMYNLFANIEYYYGATKYVTAASCIAAAANMVLNSFFIKKYGYLAAGYTTIACYIVYAASHYIFMKVILRRNKNSGKIYNEKFLWLTGICAFAAALGAEALYGSFLVRMLLVLMFLLIAFVKRKTIRNVWTGLKEKKV